MNFYNALQMDPAVLKNKSANCNTLKEKSFYWSAITIRSLLIVAFAIFFISTLSNLFGSQNTPFAVVLFCILLSIRFVNFQYCIYDSLLTLAITLLILLITPTIETIRNPVFSLILHFITFFIMLFMTSQSPELGNGGLYSFAYIYLSGNPVYGDVLFDRFKLAIVGYIICAFVLYRKHRHMHMDIRFHHIISKFNLHNIVHLWILRITIAISIVITMGQFFGFERFMWIGFACSSLLAEYPYSFSVKTRFWRRIVGVICGCLGFLIIFYTIPQQLHSLIGPVGGFCLGFCTDYRYKTALNCFGALVIATATYGIHGAVFLRIANTLFGVIFGFVFALAFHKLVGKKFVENNA